MGNYLPLLIILARPLMMIFMMEQRPRARATLTTPAPHWRRHSL
ncbi:DUF2933 domain-containing protein [Sporichthya sp.]|nr:DUF2933 domain-containing protein [Sporichthya sp.]